MEQGILLMIRALRHPHRAFAEMVENPPSLSRGLFLLILFSLAYLGAVAIGLQATHPPIEKVQRELLAGALWQIVMWVLLVAGTVAIGRVLVRESPPLKTLVSASCFSFIPVQLPMLLCDYAVLACLLLSRPALESFSASIIGMVLLVAYQVGTVVWLLYQHAALIEALYRVSRPMALVMALIAMGPMLSGFFLAPYLNIVI